MMKQILIKEEGFLQYVSGLVIKIYAFQLNFLQTEINFNLAPGNGDISEKDIYNL